MRLFNVLPDFPFTTSETICYLPHGLQNNLLRIQETEDLRKLGNITILSELQRMIA